MNQWETFSLNNWKSPILKIAIGLSKPMLKVLSVIFQLCRPILKFGGNLQWDHNSFITNIYFQNIFTNIQPFHFSLTF